MESTSTKETEQPLIYQQEQLPRSFFSDLSMEEVLTLMHTIRILQKYPHLKAIGKRLSEELMLSTQDSENGTPP